MNTTIPNPPDTAPYLVTLEVWNGDDGWLRRMIRGDAPSAQLQRQRVIVQGSDEARRICHRMGQLKYARHKPYGGSMRHQIEKHYDGWRLKNSTVRVL